MNPINKLKPSVGSGLKLNETLDAKPSGKSNDAILGTGVTVATGPQSETILKSTVSQVTTSVAPVLLIPSGFLRFDPKLLELKQQLVSQSQNSSVVMAIKREHNNNNNSSSNYSDSSTFTGDNDDDDDFSSDSFSSKLARTDVAVDYSLSSSGVGSSLSTLSSGKSNGPRRHTGPRKPKAHVKLSPEEEERRHVRRERNKHAAAKCRQKRVDLTNTLLAETEKLESEQAKLQADIKAFQHEKDELEFILEAHRLHCGIAKSSGSTVAVNLDDESVGKLELTDANNAVESSRVSIAAATMTTSKVVGATANTNRRPNTLATWPPVEASSSGSGAGQIAGIAITTPSSGLNVFTLGLESMMDGHTGLTPITGLPVSYAGLSTPLMIAGSQLFLNGNQSQQSDLVSTPCKAETQAPDLL